MKNNLPQTLLDVLARCRQALTARGLSLTSRKLYLSDIKNFLTYLESSSRELNIASLSSPSSYRQYLAMIESKGASRSTLNRSLAALRQLGSIVSESYSVQDPTSVLSLSGKPSEISAAPQPFEEYIKAFTNYLTSQHLSLQTIKSYKSDVIQYLQWAVSVSGSNNVERVLTQNLSEKYLNHLYKIGNTAGATLERKNASIVRFHDWLHHTYPTHTATDNIANVISEAPKYIKTYQNTASDLPSIQPVKIKKTFKLPQLPSLPSLPALNFATAISGILIFVLISGMGFFGYRQLASDRVLIAQAYPTSPVTPNRQLSFQGRLESSTGTPITSATNFIFKLWNDPNAGSELYTSGTCSITPDTDGVFATQIGSTCGSAIPSSVFSENSNVYLEVTVGAETLTPRQQIATVAYALNSETLQGLPIPATMSAVTNSIVAMNQWGEIVIGEQSPTLRGVSGTLQISAPSVTITTLSNGNIVLDPNGSGIIDLSANTTVTGTLTLPNSSILTGDTTYLRSSRGLAFGANETYYINSSGTGNLNALTLTGDLTVTGDDIYMNTNTAGYLLIADGTNYNPTAVSGDITINSSGVTAIGADKVTEATLKAVDTASDEECLTYETTTGDFEWQACDVVSSSNWRYNLGTLSPNNDTVDLLVGGNATSSAKAAFLNINSGTPTASVSAGTNGAAFLTADGYLSTTARQSLTLGNSASFNTTGNTLINPNGTGDVGIGTTAPSFNLHVQNNNASFDAGDSGLGIVNSTAGTVSNRGAASFRLSAQGWNPSASASQQMDWSIIGDPQTNNNPTFRIYNRKNGGSWTNILSIDSSGQFETPFKYAAYDTREVLNMGMKLSNDAAATVSYDQYSPYFNMYGSGWKTGGTPASQNMSIGQVVAPEQGSTYPIGVWKMAYGIGATPVEANELFRLEWGDRLGAVFNKQNIANYIMNVNGTLGVNTTGPDAKIDSLATSGEQLRLTYTDGSVYSGMTLDSSGNLTIDNTGTKTIVADDLQISGDDLIMGTNTSGMLLIADGTNFNPTAVSGDITINSSGVTAIGADKVTEAMLKAVDSATDEECLTYETTTGDFEWQTCSSVASNDWRYNLGTLSPSNDTVDLLIGANATSSAKFAFINVNSGVPTASISGTVANQATFLDGNGFLSTTNRKNITIGNSATYNSTGDTLINSNGTGFVGIGTTSPSTTLDVGTGRIRVTGNGVTPTSGTGIELFHDGTTGDILSYNRTGSSYAALRLRGSTLKLYGGNGTAGIDVDSSGNVGIGTTGPDAKLDSLSTTEQLRLTYTDGSVYSSHTVDSSGNLTIDNTGTKTVIADDLQITGDDLIMGTNTSGMLLIADGTNFNPTAVSGDITINSSGVTAIGADKVTEATLKAVDTASDEECLTYETTTGDFEWQACDVVSSSNWRYNLGTLSPNNDTVDLLVGGNATSSAKAAFLNINSGTPTASVSAGTNGAAFLTADGYLSTTARQSLTLGNSASFNTTGNTLINPNGTGNVGIGTTNPESKLHISGSGADQLYIERTSGAVGKFRLGLANANNNFWIYDVAQSAARIAINENGNVGVGTTGPDRRLDVLDASSPQLRLTQADGTTYADFQVNSSGDLIAGVDGTTSQLVLDNGGNIGIGTATPGVALDIVGNVQNTTATTSVYTIRSTGNTTTGRSLIQIIRNSGTDLGWDFGSNVALNGNDDFTFREIGGTGDTLSRITIKKTTGRVGINTTGADANLDSLATSGEQLRLTHTDGSVYSGMTLDSSGNLTIDNTGTKTVIADDLQITGDDLIMGTNTSGMLLIADGTNYNPTAVSGDITINSSGVTAIGADKVTEATLKAVDTASDEECLTYETTTGDFEWQTCGSAMTQYWRENLGSLSPTNDTMDLLIGSNATASAKFAVLNVNSGTPTASVSAGTNGAAFLTADGYLSTTARQSLTLGNSTAYNTTGNTLINPNGTGYVGIGLTAPTTNLEVADNIRITGLTPTFKFNETDNVEWQYIVGGDQWVLQRSGTDRMVVNNAGTLIMKGDIYNNEDTTVNIGASASNSNLRLFSNNSANAILTTEGYFGIGTLSPLGTFDVRSKLGTTPVATISGTTAMASLVVDQSGTGDIITASASGATKFVVKTDGSILASSYVDKDNTAYYLTPAATGTSLSIDGNIVSNGAFSITSNATDGDITINPGNGSVIIGGAGKLNATTVDPPYTINGEKFATYMAGMTGVKEETTGTVVTTESSSYGYQTVLDFANAPSGSDLWLFAKTTNLQTNIDQLVVLLSAMGNTKTWYNIDREAGKVYIYSSTPTTISYRLTAPRFDYTDWSNSRRDSSTGLVINDDSTWSNSSAPTIAIPNYTIELDQVASDSAEVSYSLKDSLGNVIRELVTASNAFIANLTAGSIKTQELASPLISTDTLLTDSTLTIKGTNSSAEPLVKVEGEIEAATVSARTAKLAEIVTNKLYAQEIIAGKITAGSIDGLDAKIASLAATTSELTEGELMTITDHIKARLALLTGNEPSAADIPVTQESTTSITLPAVETVTNNTLIASDSATLSNFTAANLTVSTFLTVTGHSILTDVTVTDRLSTPIIESTCSTEIIDCIPTLDIQPAGGIINLASGTLIIDSTGEVAINGNLTVTGQILTSSIDTGSLSLGNTPIDATSSALGKLLAIYNENGQQVATIDASGSANLASVTTQLINIAGASAKSSDSTAGTSTLEAGMTELTITNSYVDVNSLIYITPTTDTANQVLYVANKSAGSFTVAVRDPTASNITFNWWIIGTNPTP